MECSEVFFFTRLTYLPQAHQVRCLDWWVCCLCLVSNTGANCLKVSNACSARACCRSSLSTCSSVLLVAVLSATRLTWRDCFQARQLRCLSTIADPACARVLQPRGACCR